MTSQDASYDTIRAVEWHDGVLKLIDQRLLPARYEVLSFERAADVAQAITDMVVRGAPAIGVTAAYGVVLAVQECYARSPASWKSDVPALLGLLRRSRPTAVNLFWALDRMERVMAPLQQDPLPMLLAEAKAIHEEDIVANRRMGDLGAALMDEVGCVLTHCNTGSLATGGYGTALGVIRSAWSEGRIDHVYADETRPWLQGARLTAWELVQDSIPVTLIVEGAAASLMRTGKVKWVIVGADRITANGDVANKIGTYGLAVLAKHHGVKFMVVAPSTTIDMTLSRGEDIPIETRPESEVLCLGAQRVAAEGAHAWNPSFDMTPAALIDAIVTERGVLLKPNSEGMARLMGG